MDVVFSWAFVREAPVEIEAGEIARIRDDLGSCIAANTAAKVARKKADGSRSSENPLQAYQEASEHVHKATEYARKIGELYPFLGDMLQHGYWEAITPPNFAEANRYTLMRYRYIVDAEFQSRGGTTLKKRITTLLRRLAVDNYDSGWKVFFVIDG